MGTFGTGFDDASVLRARPVDLAPWSLSDEEFKFCMKYIDTGRRPDPDEVREKFHPRAHVIPEVFRSFFNTETQNYFEKATSGSLVYAASQFLRRGVLIGLSVNVVGDISIFFAEDSYNSIKNERSREAFNLDKVRRNYLSSRGLSSVAADT